MSGSRFPHHLDSFRLYLHPGSGLALSRGSACGPHRPLGHFPPRDLVPVSPVLPAAGWQVPGLRDTCDALVGAGVGGRGAGVVVGLTAGETEPSWRRTGDIYPNPLHCPARLGPRGRLLRARRSLPSRRGDRLGTSRVRPFAARAVPGRVPPRAPGASDGNAGAPLPGTQPLSRAQPASLWAPVDTRWSLTSKHRLTEFK